MTTTQKAINDLKVARAAIDIALSSLEKVKPAKPKKIDTWEADYLKKYQNRKTGQH